MTTPNKEYKHIPYGKGFRVSTIPHANKLWHERTLLQKLLFWKKFKITDYKRFHKSLIQAFMEASDE